LASWKVRVVHAKLADESPMTSRESRIVCTAGSRNCISWNGGTVNAALNPAPPDNSPVVESDGDIDTVNLSSRS
jgi:hypothetical protein